MTHTTEQSMWLFSHGTRQDPEVQVAVFDGLLTRLDSEASWGKRM